MYVKKCGIKLGFKIIKANIIINTCCQKHRPYQYQFRKSTVNTLLPWILFKIHINNLTLTRRQANWLAHC